MQIRNAIVWSAVGAAALGCGTNPTGPSTSSPSVAFDFRQGSYGWTCTASGYSIVNPEYAQIVTEYRPLLGPLADQGSAWFLYGAGPLLPFCTKHIGGLSPNRSYAVDLTIEIGTNIRSGCGGPGGPPSEDRIIAGMSPQEPKPFVKGSIVDVNLGFDINGVSDQVVTMGTIAGAEPGPPCSGSWELKTLKRVNVPLTASSIGDGWFVAGLGIGEHRLGVYLTKFAAVFR